MGLQAKGSSFFLGFLQRGGDSWACEQVFGPTFHMGIIIVDGDVITLAASVKRNKTHVRQGILAANQIVFISHFAIQVGQILLQFLLRFVGIAVVGDVGSGGVKPGTEIIDPDACFGALQQVGRHEPDLRKFFVKVFVDDGRLINDPVAVDQDRHLAVRIFPGQIVGLIFEIHFDQLVRKFFLCQDNPCPVRIGSGVAGIKFHLVPPVVSLIITAQWFRQFTGVQTVQTVQVVQAGSEWSNDLNF